MQYDTDTLRLNEIVISVIVISSVFTLGKNFLFHQVFAVTHQKLKTVLGEGGGGGKFN